FSATDFTDYTNRSRNTSAESLMLYSIIAETERTPMLRFAFLSLILVSLSGESTLIAQTGTAPKQKPAPPAASPQREPGLYMRFETTMGSINCKLFEKEAPVTVRTMVELAVGTKSYVDPRTKQTVTGKRFFDGLTFHRVIKKFMIQGGDPLGNGSG